MPHRVALAATLLLIALAVPARAEVLWSQAFDSAALGRPLPFSIYLPSGYHDPEAAAARYPVIYLLHGVGDDETTWPRHGGVEATMDRLIGEQSIRPMIVVMPQGRRSWWVDSAAIGGAGDYATAVAVDLRAHVETTWRAETTRAGRFVAGLSMGGYGALHLAFARPDLYAGVAAMSSALWWRLTPETRLNERQEGIFRGAFGQPFEPARYLRQRADAYLDAPKAAPHMLAIFLHAGDDDNFGAHVSTFELYRLMREKSVPAELRITNGGHEWPVWRAEFAEVARYFSSLMPPVATAAK